MKKLNFTFLIVTLFFANICFATSYYIDATGGDDSNDGITESTAWQTIGKVNSANPGAGDFVLFKRGETFRGFISAKSGSSTGYLTYGAYGSGEKPRILGSVSRNSESDWVETGTNLWEAGNITINSSGVDVGNIIFNNDESVGSKKSSANDLSKQGDFYSDQTNKTLITYSVGNPALFYSGIELALRKDIIHEWQAGYVIYENLDLRYGGAHGIGGENAHHIIIRDIDFSYIGGSYQYETTRYGNGVEFWNAANNAMIEACTFSQIYDAAMTIQGDGTYEVSDIYFINNIVDRAEYSFEFWVRGEGTSAKNIYFVNNTCTNSGRGWSHTARPDPRGVDLTLWGSSAPFENIVIRNNIFSNAIDAGIFLWEPDLSDLNTSFITINNNNWYLPETEILAIRTDWDEVNELPITTLYDWEYYRTNTGQDANSITSDPLLNPDNSIISTSPCIDAGATLSYITNDFIKTSRPQGNAFDIGAFEFIDNINSFLQTIKSKKIIFPNPVSNALFLKSEIGSVITLFNINGIVLNSFISDSPVAKLDVTGLTKGTYFLKIKSQNKLDLQKVIKL